jgi:hypothetical protein
LGYAVIQGKVVVDPFVKGTIFNTAIKSMIKKENFGKIIGYLATATRYSRKL